MYTYKSIQYNQKIIKQKSKMQRKLNKPIGLFVKVFRMDDETLRNVAKASMVVRLNVVVVVVAVVGVLGAGVG